MIKKYLGCLYGCAIGDALGAPVEFMGLNEIKDRYGKTGIKDFDEWREFKPGSFTDDTQMALATAVACIRAHQRFVERGLCHPASVAYYRYLEWLETQNDPFQRRAPGNSCLNALRSREMGRIKKPINNSKGCGGVMRTAPVGLAFGPERAFQEGAEFAAITHGHPSGYLTAGVLAEMISHIVKQKTLSESIHLSTQRLKKQRGHEETLKSLEQALLLSGGKISVGKSIETLGEGWVGEEALAISVYCALKFPDDWEKGTLAAVNHSGDSDSTGSITGAILGTLLGIDSIPEKWVRQVEDSSRIKKIAEDMYRVFQKGEELSYEEYPPN